jgi:hypothetical protein
MGQSRRWEDNIKRDLIKWSMRLWTGLMTQDKVQWQVFLNVVMNLRAE